MDEVKPVQISVHPALIEEFNFIKDKLEKETGYPIRGGNPVVSKIVAEVLKKRRLAERGNIKIEVLKIKGLKKNDVFII